MCSESPADRRSARLFALLLGASLWVVQCSAAVGAMAATFLVLALARGGATVRVLLTGVVVASACGALVTLVLVLADNGQLRGMMFWLAGDLGWAAHPVDDARRPPC